MFKKSSVNRAVCGMLVFVLACGVLICPERAEAASKIKLSKTSVTLTAGQKKTLKLKKGRNDP